MSELGAMSQAWIAAEAAMPLGWSLVSLEVDRMSAQTFGGAHEFVNGEWHARARGQDVADSIEGVGSHPVAALHRLAEKLVAMRGSANGDAG